MDIDRFITEVIPIRDSGLREELKRTCRIDVFEKGNGINEVGEKDVYVRFLIDGVIRGYYVDEQGKEITIQFANRTGDIIAGSRMMDDTASEIEFTVIKRSEVLSVPVGLILALFPKYPEMADLYVFILEKCAAYHWVTRKMLYLPTARERYEWFLMEFPGLVDCMNHTYIASFLNITPVTLSRVRAGMKKEERKDIGIGKPQFYQNMRRLNNVRGN